MLIKMVRFKLIYIFFINGFEIDLIYRICLITNTTNGTLIMKKTIVYVEIFLLSVYTYIYRFYIYSNLILN